jgi:hypothetical protein
MLPMSSWMVAAPSKRARDAVPRSQVTWMTIDHRSQWTRT